jgi:hypothetical protein
MVSIASASSAAMAPQILHPSQRESAGLPPVLSPPDEEMRDLQQAAKPKPARPPGLRRLTDEEQKQLDDLKVRDREVRAHEQAHLSRGGSLARGGAHYDFEMGPDGRRYAVGGEVRIDVSEVPGDPEQTIDKMARVRQAALAPADPSQQDRQVAAEATRIEQCARAELREQASGPRHGGAEPCGRCGLDRYARSESGEAPRPVSIQAEG